MTDEQMQDIIDKSYSAQWFVWCMDEDNDSKDIESFFDEEGIIADLDHPTVALMLEEDMSYDEAESAIDKGNWKVLDDDEAQILAEEYADDLAETAKTEIPKHLQYYFDTQGYMDDIIADGRGALLAPYDGEEREQTVDGLTYYLYKQ